MKITVLIPSLNEADTINKVVRAADRGLRKYFSKHQAIIINVDGSNTDNTRTVFNRTETVTPKLSIDNSENKFQGKGANIRRGFSQIDDSDVFLLLDADVQSIEPVWIYKLLNPVIRHQAELVTPIYTRNRYEGNTTNHFSAPLLSICLRAPIAQPIAGDFAISQKIAQNIMASFSQESDYQYGIDTLISWTAVGLGMPIRQVSLGKKIHKPSFPKIVPMFHQVCETTLSQIIRFKNEILIRQGQVRPKKNPIGSIDASFVRMPDTEKINDLEKLSWKMQEKLAKKNFDRLSVFLNYRYINTELWTSFLALLAGKILNLKAKPNPDYLRELADLTTPIYLLRVVNYIRAIGNLETAAVVQLLEDQTAKLDEKFSHFKFGK